MSYAWKQLHVAVKILAGSGSQRDRLISAYAKLLDLKQKDVPAEIRTDFSELMKNINRFSDQPPVKVAETKVASLSNEEMRTMICLIIDMYDAVTRYQPMLGAQLKSEDIYNDATHS
jgi:hypothetical protein